MLRETTYTRQRRNEKSDEEVRYREAKRLQKGTIKGGKGAIIVLLLRHLAAQSLLESATATAT